MEGVWEASALPPLPPPPSLSNVAVAVAAAKVQQGKFTYDQMMQQGMKEDALK